jgi:hypothetical protein
MDLNSTYFIELKGRFQTEIGTNFGWTWVNWTRNIFPNITGLSFNFWILRLLNRNDFEI